MIQKLKNSLVLETEKLSLKEIPVGRILVKEGKNLPNSTTEDVGGISLRPIYSAKQLRSIHRRKVKQRRIIASW